MHMHTSAIMEFTNFWTLNVRACQPVWLRVFTSQLNAFAVGETLSQYINFCCCRINKCGLQLKTFLEVVPSLQKLTQLEALRCPICVQLKLSLLSYIVTSVKSLCNIVVTFYYVVIELTYQNLRISSTINSNSIYGLPLNILRCFLRPRDISVC